MTENARHWKQTTTGRKNIPIAEFEKSVKKPKRKQKKLKLKLNKSHVRSSCIGRMTTQTWNGVQVYGGLLMTVTYVYRGVTYTKLVK